MKTSGDGVMLYAWWQLAWTAGLFNQPAWHALIAGPMSFAVLYVVVIRGGIK